MDLVLEWDVLQRWRLKNFQTKVIEVEASLLTIISFSWIADQGLQPKEIPRWLEIILSLWSISMTLIYSVMYRMEMLQTHPRSPFLPTATLPLPVKLET